MTNAGNKISIYCQFVFTKSEQLSVSSISIFYLNTLESKTQAIGGVRPCTHAFYGHTHFMYTMLRRYDMSCSLTCQETCQQLTKKQLHCVDICQLLTCELCVSRMT